MQQRVLLRLIGRGPMRFRSRLVVHLNKLASNLEWAKSLAPGKEILFMVKANAYGHGMVPIVKYAFEVLKIKEFGCATLAEALTLRRELPGLEFDIYVFSDTQLMERDNADLYLSLRILPVLSNIDELKYVLSQKEFIHLPLVLKFNTGMNRLGILKAQVPEVIDLLKKQVKQGQRSRKIHHLMTHYANAGFSMELDPYNLRQREGFEEIKKVFADEGFEVEKTSQGNSGMIEQGVYANANINTALKIAPKDSHVRPGLMLYGPSSLNSDVFQLNFPMKNKAFQGQVISSLETYILRAFPVKKGEAVGYNSIPAPRDGWMTILAIGYGDGIFNRYAGAHLQCEGFCGEIFGRVSMDMAHVLFPLEAKSVLKESQLLTIWGGVAGDFQKFSEETHTIPYEIFCALLPRIYREYRLQ